MRKREKYLKKIIIIKVSYVFNGCINKGGIVRINLKNGYVLKSSANNYIIGKEVNVKDGVTIQNAKYPTSIKNAIEIYCDDMIKQCDAETWSDLKLVIENLSLEIEQINKALSIKE